MKIQTTLEGRRERRRAAEFRDQLANTSLMRFADMYLKMQAEMEALLPVASEVPQGAPPPHTTRSRRRRKVRQQPRR